MRSTTIAISVLALEEEGAGVFPLDEEKRLVGKCSMRALLMIGTVGVLTKSSCESIYRVGGYGARAERVGGLPRNNSRIYLSCLIYVTNTLQQLLSLIGLVSFVGKF